MTVADFSVDYFQWWHKYTLMQGNGTWNFDWLHFSWNKLNEFLFLQAPCNSRAEPWEAVKMRAYNVFYLFSNLIIMLNKNWYHAQSKLFRKIFQGAFYISSLYVSLRRKENVKFYIYRSTERCISAERMRETEKNAAFPASLGHICQ